ncbi:FAD-dependent oxidoreductase [Aurantiacibacter sp. MUD61]|uniref:FAD-dependent oxidoreductase n=1 Tax=Aurantiacibacter sp. MUD61 TaxID=3009083 RepID=UPI0022F065E6|nr:NAD(P)/FAD-dependent oxidoreductase [Aurantiacibacter sp. MUD61]
MQKIDIAIAGCGIAGLAAALMLHRQGHRITLFERFAEARPIGSGLMIQPTGLAVLDALSLAETVLTRGAPVDGLWGLNTEGEPVLEAAYADLPYPDAVGIGIHRASLFATLFDAVRAEGIAIETGRQVTGTSVDTDGRTLSFADGSASKKFDLVIDSLGIGSPLVPPAEASLPFGALWATVDWPGTGPFNPRLLEQRYRRADQMVGLLPIGEGKAAFFWSLKGENYESWKTRGMAAFHEEVCTLWPALDPVMEQLTDPEQLTFARYAHRTSPHATGDRIAHIGDSWHAASPQLGQGANMALLDARGLAVAMEKSDDLDEALSSYVRLRASHVRLYQALTWLFTPPFQSDSIWPALFRDLFMAPASRVPPGPGLKAHLVAGLAGARLDELELSVPDYTALTRGQSASSTSSRAAALPQS